MGTNGTDIATETKAAGKRTLDDRIPEAAYLRFAAAMEPVEATDSFVLAPLVDKIAYSMARGLVVAMKELENHIASETRKVGDTVDRRLDIIQTNLQELSAFVAEQRSTNSAVQGQLHDLSVGLKEAGEFSASVSQRIDRSTASLQESDARLAAELGTLQSRTDSLSQTLSERIDGICKDLGLQQEDLTAVKEALSAFSSRVDALVARLDRQAEAVRSMYTAYSQRETELEQLVDGLAKLRAFPTPLPATAL